MSYARRVVDFLAERWFGALVLTGLILLCPRDSHAWVNITYPANDSTVSGTITVKASVTNDYWSQLVIDGKPVASSSIGNVSFRWDTTTVGDGAHWVVVKGYPSGKPANSSDKVMVSVLNHAALDRSMHFSTRPSSWPLPNGSWCAQVIPWESEMVPNNTGSNSTKPSQGQLDAYVANGYASNVYDGQWAFARVNGQYTGTTDMINRWAACKWGIDEDVVRAQALAEHWDWDQNRPGDKRTSYSQCVNGSFTSLWNFRCSNCCYQTWSLYQTKVFYNWQTWPMILNSTAFAADFRYADQRSCMNGDKKDYFAQFPSYNGHNYAADIASGNLDTILWGCIGAHYSGRWYNGASNWGAIWYINKVKTLLAEKRWKQLWPSVNWPD